MDQRVAHLIAEGVRVASFAQAPGRAIVKRLKEAGVVVIPPIGAARHAEKVAEWGVDAVVAQGRKVVGTRASFPPRSSSLRCWTPLDGSGVAVVAAGGFTDGRGFGPLSWHSGPTRWPWEPASC
ncbi:MAG: hypothetical protein Ct9H300mP12_06340 [Acidimicrobiales bacterium]|nr:MAG: hypothetical protein Ct9H300mP12_06340 [Acidimicrobiales bacterium]